MGAAFKGTTKESNELPPYLCPGQVARFDHREDEDYYSQAGALFRIMNDEQKKSDE